LHLYITFLVQPDTPLLHIHTRGMTRLWWASLWFGGHVCDLAGISVWSSTAAATLWA